MHGKKGNVDVEVSNLKKVLFFHSLFTKLVHSIGPQVRTRKTLSKNEIADLLDNMLVSDARNSAKAATAVKMKSASKPQPPQIPGPAPMPAQELRKDGFNWTLATLVALTVLIMQLFYLVLLLN